MSAAIFRVSLAVLALALAVRGAEQPYARTVAVVWDGSTGQTPENSRAGQMLGPVLERLGLRARYLTVNRPLPDLRTEQDVRAVISFFDRNRMPDPAGYTAWVEGLTTQGKYFVCLGDPGIDYDDQGKPTPPQVKGRFWKLLGLMDTGRWEAVTYDHRVLSITEELIGFERPIGPVLPPYRLTAPASAGIQSHLIVGAPGQAKEPAGKAHLVVTGASGGYVAAGYTHFEPAPGNRQWHINPTGFLERALHVANAPKPDPSVISGRPVLLLVVARANIQGAATSRRRPRFETKVQRLAAEFPALPIAFANPAPTDGVHRISITAEDLERSARLSQVEKALRDARTDRVLPASPEDHRLDWERADRALLVEVDSRTWKVGPGLPTVRFDHADQLHVDLTQSAGVVGANYRDGSLYVALDPEVREARVALSSGKGQAVSAPLLVDARWRVSGVKRSATEVRCRVKGYGPGEMTWQVPQGGEWWVEVLTLGRKYIVNVGRDGLLTTTIPLSAVNGLDIVLRRRI